MPTVTFAILIISAILLISASYEDVRTRIVNPSFSAIIGILGIILLAEEIMAYHAEDKGGIITILSATLMLAATYTDSRLALPALTTSAILGTTMLLTTEVMWVKYVSISVIDCLLFIILHRLNILPGGADVKSLVSLAILLPFFLTPSGGIPAYSSIRSLVFSPSVSIFILSLALMLIAYVPACMFANRGKKERWRIRLFGTLCAKDIIDETRLHPVKPIPERDLVFCTLNLPMIPFITLAYAIVITTMFV